MPVRRSSSGIKVREVVSDNLLSRIALCPLGAGIPVHDVPLRIQHIDGVVRHAFDQQPEPLLGVLQLGQTTGQLLRALFGALFKSLV